MRGGHSLTVSESRLTGCPSPMHDGKSLIWCYQWNELALEPAVHLEFRLVQGEHPAVTLELGHPSQAVIAQSLSSASCSGQDRPNRS
jgi:hypothetical protein